MSDYADDFHDYEPTYSTASKKKDLLERIKHLEELLEASRREVKKAQAEKTVANRDALERVRRAEGQRAAAEMTVRSIKAAVQVLLTFASDEPPARGKFYIDPGHGAVTRIPAASPRKA